MRSKYIWVFVGFFLAAGFVMTAFGAPRAYAQATTYPYTSGSPNGSPGQSSGTNTAANTTITSTNTSANNNQTSAPTYLYIAPPVLPAAEVNVPYYQTISAQTNTEGPFMWSLLAGRVPFGLTLRTATSGTAIDIIGTPVTTGISNFTVGVSNEKFSATQTYFMVVNAGNGASMLATTTVAATTTATTPLTPNTGVMAEATAEPSIIELQATLADLTARLAALQAMAAARSLTGPATPQAPNTGANGYFYRDLTVGDRGADVQSLQAFLNAHGFVITNGGVGSPGNETTFFGMMTQQALARFQAANGIAPARGYFGPVTRARIEAMMGAQ